MKIFVQIAATIAYLTLTMSAAADEAVTTFNAAPSSITAGSDEEAVLLALPANAPAELALKHADMQAKHSALSAERSRLLEVVRKVDFDSAPETTAQLLEQLAACQEKLDALLEAEESFVQDKEQFLADGQSAAKLSASND